MRALILACALGACAPLLSNAPAQEATTGAPAASAETNLAQMPSWENARAAGVDFRAVGSEPGWMLDIYQREQILLLWDYGEQLASFALTEPSYPQEGATLYQARNRAHTLSITIRRFPCADPMSGERFPASVAVMIDGRSLSGCGRSV